MGIRNSLVSNDLQVGKFSSEVYETIKLLLDNINLLDEIGVSFTRFFDTFIGVFEIAPTERLDGSPIRIADMYINDVTDDIWVYSGDYWVKTEHVFLTKEMYDAITIQTNQVDTKASTIADTYIHIQALALLTEQYKDSALLSKEEIELLETQIQVHATAVENDRITVSGILSVIEQHVIDTETKKQEAILAATNAALSESAANTSALNSEQSAIAANTDKIASEAAKDASESFSIAAGTYSSASGVSATEAATSATAASGSASAALTSETNAALSESIASDAAASATTSETSASTSASNALVSEQNAKASETEAEYWAVQAQSLVTDGVLDDLVTSTVKTWSSSKIQNELDTLEFDDTSLVQAIALKADASDVLTPVPTGALFTDTVYDDTALQSSVSTLETNKADKTELFSGSYVDLTNVPTTFTPSAHTHTLSEITDSGSLAAINTNASTVNYLRGDGTWVTPPDTDTTYSAGTGITFDGTTINNAAPHEATNLGSSGTGATRTITSSTGTNTSITYSATDIGLGNVDNTSDINKPISTATQTALNSIGTIQNFEDALV